MSLSLRISLVVVSLFTFVYILKKVRKSQMKISDSLYWIFVSSLLLIVAIFPVIPIGMSKLMGIESPANFVYLCIIFLLVVHNFTMTVKVSKLETKLESLVQRYAIDHRADNGADDREKTLTDDRDKRTV